MKIHNMRSAEQWNIINTNVDLNYKKVIDLGCGYGDILLKCSQVGADCMGIEYDPKVFNDVVDRMIGRPVLLCKFDLGNIKEHLPTAFFDVGICFSVLPYLKNADNLLEWISLHCKIGLIECQYAGDGPGFSTIKNDDDMALFLLRFWRKVKKIGETEVKSRGFRSIWKCE